MLHTIEELSLNAWPALQTVLHDGWVLRFAAGYTRRANSVNPLYAAHTDLACDAKVAACEQFYRHKGLNVVFKLTAASYPDGLDRFLAARGYVAEAQTSVQLLDLRAATVNASSAVVISETLTDGWFDTFCQMSGLAAARRPTARQMLATIVPRVGFASVYHQATPVACGLAVAERGYVGLYDIVTDSRYRRQGYGEQLVLGLLHWGAAQGATTAYLQVMTNNPPALALYAKLGFRELYQYWYRVKA